MPTKAGDGDVRHDLEPLASGIPALADVADVTWLGGTLGDVSPGTVLEADGDRLVLVVVGE